MLSKRINNQLSKDYKDFIGNPDIVYVVWVFNIMGLMEKMSVFTDPFKAAEWQELHDNGVLVPMCLNAPEWGNEASPTKH